MKVRSYQGSQSSRDRRRHHPQGWLVSGLALGGMFCALPSWAQQAPATAPSAAASGALEEVVVTARKKREKLSDVPLSVTALSAKALDDAGVKNVQDVTRLTPGLTINSNGAEATLTPTIRGLTNLNGGAGDPNVAVFLDGVYLANPSAISLGMMDVERIEIIKGPVGALYGRNAFAGVINYVTKRPTELFEGTATVGVSQREGRQASASIRGALRPGVVRAGLAVSYDKLGYTHQDPVNGLKAGGYEKRDAQLSLDVTPTSRLGFNAAVYYGDDFFQNSPTSTQPANCGRVIQGAGITAGQFMQYCGEVKGTGVQVANINPASGVAGNSRDVLFTSLRMNYDMDWADLSAIYGYNEVRQFRFNDFSGFRNGLPFYTSQAGYTAQLPVLFGGQFNNDDKSIEVRLASKLNQRLRWAAGVYGFQGERTTATLVAMDGSSLPAGVGLRTLDGGTVPNAQNFVTATGAFNSATTTKTRATDEIKSAFASLDYDILAGLTASGEFRHTRLNKTQQVQTTGAREFESSISFNNYRGTLRWKPATTSTLYASYANGTKGGGFNPNGVANPTTGRTAAYEYEITFAPETNTTLEGGWKQSMFGGKVQAGLALFRVQSKNLQINGPSDHAGTTGLLVKNFGNLVSKGFEFDLAARPISSVTMNLGYGYVSSKFGEGTIDYTAADALGCAAIASCASRVIYNGAGTPVAMNISGMAPPQFSKNTFNTGLQYNGQLTEAISWFGRVDYRYESKQSLKFGNGNPLGINYIGARNVVNLRAGLEKGDYKLQVYVNNATNNQTPDNASNNVRLNDFNGQMVAYLPAQRTVGTTLSVKF